MANELHNFKNAATALLRVVANLPKPQSREARACAAEVITALDTAYMAAGPEKHPYPGSVQVPEMPDMPPSVPGADPRNVVPVQRQAPPAASSQRRSLR